jgi:hypothetical protein
MFSKSKKTPNSTTTCSIYNQICEFVFYIKGTKIPYLLIFKGTVFFHIYVQHLLCIQ